MTDPVNPVLAHFGRPSEAVAQLWTVWPVVALRAIHTLAVSIAALTLSAALASSALVLGLLRPQELAILEQLTAYLQTVPIVVVVTVSFLIQRSLLGPQSDVPGYAYALMPAAISLVFPPLANGIKAAHRITPEVKQMLRLWGIGRWRRVLQVYLPIVTPEVLTGIRSSATWAVGATLVVETMLNGVPGSSDTLGVMLVGDGTPSLRLVAVAVSCALGYLVYATFVMLQGAIERRLHGQASEAIDNYPLQGQ